VADSITLPRSGLVLRTEGGRALFFRPPGMNAAVLCPQIETLKPTATFMGESIAGDDEADCIAWLDSRVLALRVALLPKDAREIVAKALHDVRKRNEREGTPISAEQYRDADAVLAALGIAP